MSQGSTSRNSPATTPARSTSSTRSLVLTATHPEPLGPLAGECRELVQEHPDVVGVPVDHVEQLVAEHGELLRRRTAGLGDAVGAEQHVVHHPVVDGGEELLLVTEKCTTTGR